MGHGEHEQKEKMCNALQIILKTVHYAYRSVGHVFDLHKIYEEVVYYTFMHVYK